MSVVVVTDTDVAAIPFSPHKNYAFRLDDDNKGPFAAMLPLSDLLNTDKEQACIQSLTEQFATINFNNLQGDELRVAQALYADPIGSAKSHYLQLLEAAKTSGIQPEHEVSQENIESVHTALRACPSYVAECANTRNLRVVIINDPLKNNIVPTGTVERGTAIGHGIYVQAQYTHPPFVLKEEMIHEVESLYNFGISPAWKSAIGRNARHESDNPAYAYLVNEGHPYILRTSQLAQKKSNMALFPFRPFPSPYEMQDLRPFREAIPDIYHFKDMVEERLERSPIKIGGILGIVGAKKYVQSDAIMEAAFPDAWLMLEGAPEGMKLVQHNTQGDLQYGKINVIPVDENFLTGFAPVLSLKDYCEQDIATCNQRLVMLRAAEQTKGKIERGGITPLQNESGNITPPSVYRPPGDKPLG